MSSVGDGEDSSSIGAPTLVVRLLRASVLLLVLEVLVSQTSLICKCFNGPVNGVAGPPLRFRLPLLSEVPGMGGREPVEVC